MMVVEQVHEAVPRSGLPPPWPDALVATALPVQVDGRPLDPVSSYVMEELVVRHCVELLSEAFAAVAPAYMARVQRIGRLAAVLAPMCGLDAGVEIERLAFLSQLGSLSLPESIVLKLHRGELLTSAERHAVRSAPRLGEQLLAKLPGHAREAEIVRLHDVHAVPQGELPLEAAVIRVAIGYDRLEMNGRSPAEAIAVLRSRHPMYSEHVLDRLEAYVVHQGRSRTGRRVPIGELVPGMVLSDDVVGTNGALRLGAGQHLNTLLIDRLRTQLDEGLIPEAVWVADPPFG